MKITLITPELHSELLNIYSEFPNLTLQNIGYQHINKSKLSQEELTQIKRIEEILNKTILGFSSFTNFKLSPKTQELVIRFQYNWEADNNIRSIPFIGVGYILLDELLNGFRE